MEYADLYEDLLISMWDALLPYVKLLVIPIILLIIYYVILCVCRSAKNSKIRNSIYSGEFISYEEFEKNWGTTRRKKGSVGYKYNDGPGCYVITLYDFTPQNEEDYKRYENIYIGQSVNVCQRVHNHFNGKGNGDVYADIKYGKKAYVSFVRCEKSQMNKTEKELIAAFNATSSYNKTRGGSAAR